MKDKEKKPKCEVEVFSRITGFFRPVKEWNPGKVEEFKDRKKYDLKFAGKSKDEEEIQDHRA